MGLSQKLTNNPKVFNYLGLCYIQLAKKEYSTENINFAIQSFREAFEIEYNKGIEKTTLKLGR